MEIAVSFCQLFPLRLRVMFCKILAPRSSYNTRAFAAKEFNRKIIWREQEPDLTFAVRVLDKNYIKLVIIQFRREETSSLSLKNVKNLAFWNVVFVKEKVRTFTRIKSQSRSHYLFPIYFWNSSSRFNKHIVEKRNFTNPKNCVTNLWASEIRWEKREPRRMEEVLKSERRRVSISRLSNNKYACRREALAGSNSFFSRNAKTSRRV